MDEVCLAFTSFTLSFIMQAAGNQHNGVNSVPWAASGGNSYHQILLKMNDLQQFSSIGK